MCDRMLPPFAVALGLSPDYFAPYFANEAHANLRFLHYPPQDTLEDNTFGQAPHTDNSFMTALARAEVPGLALRLRSGEWFAPPIIPGTFLINLGNIMRRWSNDSFLSTPHGVIDESGTDRYSIAYFHSPNPVAVVECVPTCTGAENPPRYPPATYRDLVLEFYRAIIFTRRVTAPRLRSAPSGRSHNAQSTVACLCSLSIALSPTAAPPFAPIAPTNRCASWCPASSRTRPPSLPDSVNRGAPRCRGFTVHRT